MAASRLRSAVAVTVLVASSSALQPQMWRSPAPSSAVLLRRTTLPRLEASDKSAEAESKQLAADRAALMAERATLQAEVLSLRGQKMKLEASPLDAPPPPVAAAAVSTERASLEALCRVLNGTEFPGVIALQAAATSAWDVARRQQTEEIATLTGTVQLAKQVRDAETPEEELGLSEKAARATLFFEESERSRKASLSLSELWLLSENRSFDSATERRVRARGLPRQVLGFLGRARVGGRAVHLVCVRGRGSACL